MSNLEAKDYERHEMWNSWLWLSSVAQQDNLQDVRRYLYGYEDCVETGSSRKNGSGQMLLKDCDESNQQRRLISRLGKESSSIAVNAL